MFNHESELDKKIAVSDIRGMQGTPLSPVQFFSFHIVFGKNYVK